MVFSFKIILIIICSPVPAFHLPIYKAFPLLKYSWVVWIISYIACDYESSILYLPFLRLIFSTAALFIPTPPLSHAVSTLNLYDYQFYISFSNLVVIFSRIDGVWLVWLEGLHGVVINHGYVHLYKSCIDLH